MRKSAMTLDREDKRAVASGAAVALGVVTGLALRADWLLASGILHFQRTGRNVAAYVLGTELLPWAAAFTAVVAAGAVLAAACAVGVTKIPGNRAAPSGARRGPGAHGTILAQPCASR